MAEPKRTRERARSIIVASVTIASLALGLAARAAPVPIDDPEIVAGTDALAAGDVERARTILERASPRSTADCTTLRESLDGDDPQVLRACHGAASAWVHLGLARGLGGDATLAHQAFARGLAIEPEARPRAALTPPKLEKLFEAARQAALGREQASDPGAIAGLDHHPPLLATRGQALSLDVRPQGEWTRGGSIDVVYVTGGFTSPPLRARLHPAGDLASVEIPAGVLLATRVIHYRFDAVDPEGHVHTSRWYPVQVVESLGSVETRVWDALADEIDGAPLAAVRELGVAVELAPATAPPEGARAVSRRPESPDRSLAGEVVTTLFR